MFQSRGGEKEQKGSNEFPQEVLPGVLMLRDFALWGDYYSHPPD